MDVTVKCPKCLKPLGVPADGSIATQCKSCGSTVLLPTLHAKAINFNSDSIAAGFGPFSGKAKQIARMWNDARTGNTVEAIRLYRQTFGGDPRKADAAVAALNSGRPLLLAVGSAAAAGASSGVMKIGCLAVMVLAAFAGAGWLVLSRPPRNPPGRPVAHRVPPATTRSSSTVAIPQSPPAVPVAPGFARLVMQFGSEGTVDGQFDDARSIAVDGAGHIYVGEYTGGRVQVFDAHGSRLKTWSADPSLPMSNLAADRNGTVYVVTGARVLRYEGMTGRPLGELDSQFGDKREGYDDIYCARDGTLYAIGAPNETDTDLVVLDSKGKIKNVFDAGKAIGEPLVPVRIAADSKGGIFLMDRSKGIYRFSADGHYDTHFMTAKPSPRGSETSTGYALAVDSQDRLLVTATEAGSISVYDRDGRYIDTLGGPTYPHGIAIDDHDTIFAAFSFDHAVRAFSENGPPVR